jgi:hypothetical protein
MPVIYGPVGQVQCMTGIVRSNGTALFQYLGLPNQAISWAITGGGMLTPYSVATDQSGRANARYDAQGYTGPLQVFVSMNAVPTGGS